MAIEYAVCFQRLEQEPLDTYTRLTNSILSESRLSRRIVAIDVRGQFEFWYSISIFLE
jgi:hypothetical protein